MKKISDAPEQKLVSLADSVHGRSTGLLRAASASKSLRADAGEAFELDSCDEMKRAPYEDPQAAQTDLISKLKDKVRSQAVRLLALETKSTAQDSAEKQPSHSEDGNQNLKEENAQLRQELSQMKDELFELQRQVSSEHEDASCKLLELHELVNDLQAVLKQECYKNEKLTAYVEMLSKIAEDKLADSKPGSANTKPELHTMLLKMKQVFEENYSLRSTNQKLTGEMTDSLENFKHRSQELRSQLKEYLGKRSKADEQLVEAEKQLQESQSEVRRAHARSRDWRDRSRNWRASRSSRTRK